MMMSESQKKLLKYWLSILLIERLGLSEVVICSESVKIVCEAAKEFL
jgi:hypothetical protein